MIVVPYFPRTCMVFRLIMLRPRFHVHRTVLLPDLHFLAKIDGVCKPSPSIGDMNIHIKQDGKEMKSKNDETNPFAERVTFSRAFADFNAGADRRSAAHKMLSLVINTAQKNIRFTTDLTKLGPLKMRKQSQRFDPVLPRIILFPNHLRRQPSCRQ